MNISREKIDDLNEVITLNIGVDDYNEKVESALKDYKKKARLDGFRPGMVPMGLIKKLYFKPVLADEINKIVSENLMNYIREEKIRILGEPLPHIDNEKEIDFDKDTEFEFSFDIGLYPEFTTTITDKDKIVYYEISLDEKEVEKAIDDVKKRHGQFDSKDVVTGSEILKGKIFQSDDAGTPVENGIQAEESTITPDVIKIAKIKKQFVGARAGQKITFDLRKAFPDDADIGSMLNISREEAERATGIFTFEISEINEFKDHEINRELFDKVYGEGQISTEEEFRHKIREELKTSYARESDYRFTIDTREYYIKQADINLPLEFLKRWMKENNEKLTDEQIEKDMNEYEEDFKWQVIKDQIIKENEIKATEEEVQDYSRIVTRNQFFGYGLYNIPDDYIDQYSREQLAKPETARKIYDQLLEEKLFRFIKERVKLNRKEVTADKFRQLFEK